MACGRKCDMWPSNHRVDVEQAPAATIIWVGPVPIRAVRGIGAIPLPTQNKSVRKLKRQIITPGCDQVFLPSLETECPAPP